MTNCPFAINLRAAVITTGISIAAAGTALAHHGWGWTEDGFFELEGTITAIDLGNPHPIIEVDVDGEAWLVELAPPRQTERAGFTAESAATGDEVTAIGYRSRDEAENRIKAARIIVNDETYDVYPARVPTD